METLTPAIATPTGAYDIAAIRADFPILHQEIHGHPLAYLDNAATTQKPRQVIEAISRYYETDNANVHRGVHTLSQRATVDYEGARGTICRFINAASDREIIFVRGTTEAINLVASSLGQSFKPGDEIVISHMEHHSNIVPWQMLAERTGAVLRVAPITDSGALDMEAFAALLNGRTRIVSIVHVSNALGTINPVAEIVRLAHAQGIPVMLDGAQAGAHAAIDVQALDCDFYTLSGHKCYGPTGIGVLYGKEALLKELPPYQAGGDMIASVTFEKTTYNSLPHKFEAGTPDIAGAIGFGAAIDYLNSIGLDRIAAHEHALLAYGTRALAAIPEVRLIGTAPDKAAVLSFIIDGIHPHDAGTILDQAGIAVRAGHHCAQPVMARYGVPATLRASFGCYNTTHEIDQLIAGIHQVIGVFAR